VPARIAGCDTLALSPEDLLLHLCYHTSYHHLFAFGLRPLCDIAETITRFNVKWRTLTERANRWGWQRGVYPALALAKDVAGARVPAEILEELCPDDATETIMQTMGAQVFTDKTLANSVSPTLAELLQNNSPFGKTLIFWQRVFAPKTFIAAQYSVPSNSPKIYLCYPRRFIDLIRHHGSTTMKHRRSVPLQALARRTKHIVKWLAGSVPDGND
jgi:hypothetical protein